MTTTTMTTTTMTETAVTETAVTAPRNAAALVKAPRLNRLDITLQALTVLMLVAAIVAVQARVPCSLYLIAAPILSIALWACAGLVIDRQALRQALGR